MSSIPNLPDQVAKRVLHFFWLVDWSGSMSGKKIAVLNQAIRESIPEIKKAISSHPGVQIMVRAIKFADRAEWHVGPQPVPIEQFVWPDLSVNGYTATAAAIRLMSAELDMKKLSKQGYRPVCILISDGYCTDAESEYDRAIYELDKLPWGKKAVRLAIAIGEDEHDYDEVQLLKFVNHKEIGLLKAHNPEELIQYIKWASVSASVGASSGKSQIGESTANNVVLTAKPQPVATSSSNIF